MNVWKVILATLVIYSAGLLTGGLLVKQTQLPRPAPRGFEPPMPARPEWVRQPQRFLERMEREVQLTPEQRERLEKIFQESHERTRILMSLIGPEMQAEIRDVREKINGELKPHQRKRFEELMRLPPPRLREMSREGRAFLRNSNPLPPGASSIEPPP